MREIESFGKTVEEAVHSGLNRLGLSRDEVDVQVLDEGSRGFLGIGFRHARVKLVSRVAEKEPNHRELVRTWLGIGDLADDDATESGDPEPESQGVAAEAGAEQGSPGLEYLQGLIQRLGLEATVTEKESEGVTLLEVEGKALGVLIGRHGETLDAIQYLVNLSANKRAHLSGDGVRARYVVDVAGYRRKREKDLKELAHAVARRVLEDGKDQALEPMSPLERRVVHLSLKDVEGIATHSEGREPFRRIVISRVGPGAE